MKTAVLVAVGVLLTGWMLVRGGTEPPGVGTGVETAFGSVTVTRALVTFVPDTQGPPSHAQHVGANGVQQLQVYVGLVNRSEDPVRYAPWQFKALHSRTDRDGQPSDGSSLGRGVLPPGASVDGQVWYDLERGESIPRWVRYSPPEGRDIEVSLRPVGAGSRPVHAGH
jgi:hypothetical protein